MFIAALFTIAETGKQPKCSSTNEWIKKMWSIYTMAGYSAVEDIYSAITETMPFAATWMDLQFSSVQSLSHVRLFATP